MPAPLLSLCCSTYSRPDLFTHSLAGLLRQTYEPLEIVVLVDGANPESIRLLEECRDPRLRWFSTEKPSGMIPAWNRVVAETKGDFVLYCADDDILLENAVDRQMQLLIDNPAVGFCHADFVLIDDDSRRIGEWRSHEGTWVKRGADEWRRYIFQPKCCMQTCVVRRALWQRVGGWDNDAGYPGDNSLYLKLLRVSDVGHVSHFACNYRVRTHSPDSWRKNANKVKEDVALARKHLANPPPQFAGEVQRLERAVQRHFSWNALSVLADGRGTAAERAEFTKWAKAELFSRGVGGWLCRMLVTARCEKLIPVLRTVSEHSRNLARSVVFRFHGMVRATAGSVA